MSDEATISSNLSIEKDAISYKSIPTGFTADVAGVNGPVPGAIAVATAGTSVDFSALTTPTLCRIQNLDDTNFVEYGIYDSVDTEFFPLGEILAGESYVLRLSRNLGADSSQLRLKADTAACKVLVEAFEK